MNDDIQPGPIHPFGERNENVIDNGEYLRLEMRAIVQLRRDELMRQGLGSSLLLEDRMVEILEHLGFPQVNKTLHSLLQHRHDFGANPIAELSQACCRDSRLVRFGKGMYGLSVWQSQTFGRGTVSDKVVALLTMVGERLHYKDIYVYLAREAEAGGNNPASSLRSRYAYDPRISALGDGFYGLRKWDNEAA